MEHIQKHFAVSSIPVADLTPQTKSKHYDFPETFEQFHTYPTDQKWRLFDDFTVALTLERPFSDKDTLESLLQPWLFFGLIFTVVQAHGRPILDYRSLVRDGHVTTQYLQEALEEWKRYEIQNPDGIQSRMDRAEQVLRLARRVMQKNCSYRECVKIVFHPRSPFWIRPSISLSIAVLGETLSAAKAQILKAAGLEVGEGPRGAEEGWGEPTYVLENMERQGWCPRHINFWESRLRSQATLWLASLSCNVTAEDRQGNYRSAHAPGCDKHCGDTYGPNMARVSGILGRAEAGIPLLKFKDDSDDSYELEVLEEGDRARHHDSVDGRTPPFGYAAISHVWSDGFGNTTENKLPPCMLLFLKRQLRQLGSRRGPFWMDTLVIPVDPSEASKRLRKVAIGQIDQVFIKSTCSIVLDLGLMHENAGADRKPTKAGVKIIASPWMSRLRTLPEAFLSRELYFAFRNGLVQFSDLSDCLERPRRERDGNAETASLLSSALLSQVDKSMRYCILDDVRRKRKMGHNGEWTTAMQKSRAIMLAHVWAAVKWRTTTHPLHEALALISLFKDNEKLASAGAVQKKPGSNRDSRQPAYTRHHRTRADEMMAELWEKRVDMHGFGWAPRTWMPKGSASIYGSYRDPRYTAVSTKALDILQSTASLDLDRLHGLRVSFPGFLLTQHNKNVAVFGQNILGEFSFAVGPRRDRYLVERTFDATDELFLARLLRSEKPLAIILSGPKPTSKQADIALLVEDVRSGEAQRVFLCQIIKRVTISRLARDSDKIQDDPGCVAEELAEDQVWFVDGYVEEAKRHRVELYTNPLDALLPRDNTVDGRDTLREAVMPPARATAGHPASQLDGRPPRRAQALPPKPKLTASATPHPPAAITEQSRTPSLGRGIMAEPARVPVTSNSKALSSEKPVVSQRRALKDRLFHGRDRLALLGSVGR
ncbi:hypothetical protein F5Y17DRAFT_460239 [Xylariaceae sp. FL0594]|nr:hypothetical protein F5Y17DRAFT_460239 [Xylariaceae sp. FL0594]